MYAVINNSMGSGSVTYECEGHERRLSDCMSPLSSTIAPCYYVLVKCLSTTDNGPGENTTTESEGTDPGGSTTSGLSAGIVAGVVASLIAVLLVVTIIVIIILLVWLKRRDKKLKPTGNTHTTTSPRSLTSPAAVTAKSGASNVTLRSLLESSQTVEQNHYSTATEVGLSAISGSPAGIV